MKSALNLTLRIWRQRDAGAPGAFANYPAENIPTDCSFLEMLDIVNERLVAKNEEPIAFDHDCREGICGMCSLVINGVAHGPERATTTCQLHMRHFTDGQIIHVEPWRSNSFPVIKDLIVDRGAFERIQQAGGFITARAGSAPDGNAIPIPKGDADLAMDAAACIGCGACVAACPNSSAMLFVAAKVSHLALLPQGAAERTRRVLGMVKAMDAEGFGNCSNYYECEAVCPVEIKSSTIAMLNREYSLAVLKDTVGK
ncbi:MAG: succinate dehydrogenase/fumarate reductase iron-sulfur subunit [Chthoniobacterales bacterium]